jgi:hypothetical protein
VIFPALIISETISNFDPGSYGYWWVFPLIAVIFSLFLAVVSYLALRFSNSGFSSRREFIACSSFQNCGYLPMNLILFSFSGMVREKLLIYLFLFLAGFNLLMWSMVPVYLDDSEDRLRPGHILLNPPVMATVFSVLWVFIFGRGSMPAVVMEPLSQIGHASFPLAMITLGAYLRRYRAYSPGNKGHLTACAVIKLILFPLIVLGALLLIRPEPGCSFFIFLQSLMPTAVSLVVIGSLTGSDNRFISSSIFYTHVVSLFTIPVWLVIYNTLF